MTIKKIQTIMKVGHSSYVLVPTDVKKKLEKGNGDDILIEYGNVE